MPEGDVLAISLPGAARTRRRRTPAASRSDRDSPRRPASTPRPADLRDHREEHGVALRMLQVERHALLVRVEQDEVAAVDARLLGPAVTSGLTSARLLDLDDLGAEPREHLRARRPRLELGQIQHTNAVECLAHRVTSRLSEVDGAPSAERTAGKISRATRAM